MEQIIDDVNDGGCGNIECCPDLYPDMPLSGEHDIYITKDSGDRESATPLLDAMDKDDPFPTLDSGERLQYDSGMQRDTTTGKTKWHLIASGPMLKRWAELMTRGAEKYDDDNWMKANSTAEQDRFKQSAYRHFMQWYYGDDDEEIGRASCRERV